MSEPASSIDFLNKYDLPRIVKAASEGRLKFILGTHGGDFVAILSAVDEALEGCGRITLPLAHLALDADPLRDYAPI
jgi:hypothetical protein